MSKKNAACRPLNRAHPLPQAFPIWQKAQILSLSPSKPPETSGKICCRAGSDATFCAIYFLARHGALTSSSACKTYNGPQQARVATPAWRHRQPQRQSSASFHEPKASLQQRSHNNFFCYRHYRLTWENCITPGSNKIKEAKLRGPSDRYKLQLYKIDMRIKDLTN